MREQIACLPEKLPRDESKIGYTERAKKFPKYAYGANGNSSLVHRVKCVWLRWYELADGAGQCSAGSILASWRRRFADTTSF